MKFLVTADNNGAIGRGAQPLVTIQQYSKAFKETRESSSYGAQDAGRTSGGQPLGNRINVVLSENPSYKIKGAVVCHSIGETLEYLKQFPAEDVYVIGGESIFRQLLEHCTAVYLTHIDYEYDADVKFPADLAGSPDWEMVEEGEEQTYFSLCYTPEIYKRKQV